MIPGDLVRLRRINYHTYDSYYLIGMFVGFKPYYANKNNVSVEEVGKTLLLLTSSGVHEFIISSLDPFQGFEVIQSVKEVQDNL